MIFKLTSFYTDCDVENLTVVCNCNGNECSQDIIDQAQTDYGAIAIRDINS